MTHPLNNVEFSNLISTIHCEQARVNHLAAERKYGDLTRSLAKIEDAARKANWFIQENTK